MKNTANDRPRRRAANYRRVSALALAMIFLLMAVAVGEGTLLIFSVARLRSVSDAEEGEYRRETARMGGESMERAYAGDGAPLGGSACLINPQGEILLKTDDYPLKDCANLSKCLDEWGVAPEEARRVLSDLESGRSGEILVGTDENAQYLVYASLTDSSLRYAVLLAAGDSGVRMDTMADITRRTALVLFALFFQALIMLLRNRARMNAMRYVDEITGGNSRERFLEEAGRICALPKSARELAVVYTSIRHFSVLCDHLSRAAANRILTILWRVIAGQMEAGESAGRLQDDNFALLFRFENPEALSNRLQAIYQETCRQMARENIQAEMQIAYGVYAPETPDAKDLLDYVSKAGMACARAPEGACSISEYDAAAHERELEEKRLEARMRAALKNRRFEVMIQPKVRLSDRSAAGGELLVRWIDPELGSISPGVFIPLFERNGFISQLDLFIMEEACHVLKAIAEANLPKTPLSINLPVTRMASPEMLEEYWELIRMHKVEPELIEFELNESLIYEHTETLVALIERIHEMGCACSIDHFGSGYSSLGLLRSIRADALKLDDNFFDNTGDRRALLVASGIIGLAKQLNMRTIAEGVETHEQVDFLSQVGCDMIQGYVFAKPMPAEQFLRMVKTGVRF